jgi:hypothetical protein
MPTASDPPRPGSVPRRGDAGGRRAATARSLVHHFHQRRANAFGLPGRDAVPFLTSTTAMELHHVPESMIVVGGGYVGMGQAQLFAHLGRRVTVVGRLAATAEPEIAAVLRGVFTDDGIDVVEGASLIPRALRRRCRGLHLFRPATRIEELGNTVILVEHGGRLLGAIAVRDELRRLTPGRGGRPPPTWHRGGRHA